MLERAFQPRVPLMPKVSGADFSSFLNDHATQLAWGLLGAIIVGGLFFRGFPRARRDQDGNLY